VQVVTGRWHINCWRRDKLGDKLRGVLNSQPNRNDPVTFDLESGVRVTCDVGYLCANFSLHRPLVISEMVLFSPPTAPMLTAKPIAVQMLLNTYKRLYILLHLLQWHIISGNSCLQKVVEKAKKSYVYGLEYTCMKTMP